MVKISKRFSVGMSKIALLCLSVANIERYETSLNSSQLHGVKYNVIAHSALTFVAALLNQKNLL